jgi:hypothetical protein
MACNCRRKSQGGLKAQGFCGTITMATAVIVQSGQSGPEVTIAVGGDRMTLGAALEKFSCGGLLTTGVRLADIVNKLLPKAWALDQAGVTAFMGRQMPLLTVKERLSALVPKCTYCSGAGCQACNNIGF